MDETAPCVVVVGASAGGVKALMTLVEGLPEDLDAAVCVVVHLQAEVESRLAQIVSRAGALPAIQANGGEHLTTGHVYIAPPDHHLVVRDRRVLVVRGPHENGLRPSIDVLFRSAARAYGRRTVAVVLSGTRDDGVAGASAVGDRGGCVFVQDPDDAEFASLPIHTVVHDRPDRVLPLAQLAPAIAAEVRRLSDAADVSENGGGEMTNIEVAYADGVTEAQRESVETALRTAISALQERARVNDRLAVRVGKAGAAKSRRRFEEIAEEARRQAETIHSLLAGPNGSDG
jgi:two-component system, chemotaxis family, protein-glutamate methylesterase/glutaminase